MVRRSLTTLSADFKTVSLAVAAIPLEQQVLEAGAYVESGILDVRDE